MLETESEIREYILEYLQEWKTCRIAAINCKCKSESMFFNVLVVMVANGEVEKDNNFIWLPKKE
ncbi:hypothetical protein [Parabacteroides distasonis]|uniref:Uncharacterized protein n=1 Tax=Parabacteroides distasonis TaxID=823 RepID=A0A5C6KL49_PARDI|nr:hypothetical protein [Parabacteroides distasonis]TWV64080.1 hypothetical protein FSA05_00205 [Parabacteroides distasonis]